MAALVERAAGLSAGRRAAGAGVVRRRPGARLRGSPGRRRAAVLIAAGLAVSPSARSALLDLLGLRGAAGERREPPPHPDRHTRARSAPGCAWGAP